jgi:hypothetical protein
LFNESSTSSHYTALVEEESEDKQHIAGPENMTKPPIYVTNVKNISPPKQLLERIAKQQYDIKAVTDNQVKVQPKIFESYRIIIKALAEKHTEFHTTN